MRILVVGIPAFDVGEFTDSIERGPDGQMPEVILLDCSSDAAKLLEGSRVDAVVTERRLEDGTDAWALLDKCLARGIPSIVFTEHGSIPDCILTLRRGAKDYIEKKGSEPRPYLLLAASVIQVAAPLRELAA